MKGRSLFLLAGAVLASSVAANDRDAYNLRAATADMAAYHRLARDGVLSREDARADVGFGSRFHEIDTNRDGTVTAEEMRRYIEQNYGVASPPPAETGTK